MQPVSAARLGAYGILGFPLAMAALPIYVHVPHFYADTLGLSIATVGTLLLLARFLDAVTDPLLGWWSDRRRDRPGGRWTFIVAGAPLLALGMVGLFNPPAWSASQLAVWLMLNLVLVYGGFSIVTISYQAFGAEISDDVAERTRVTAWREGFSLLGVFLASALPEILKKSMGDRAGFATFAYIFVPICLVAAAIAVLGSPPAKAKPAPVDSRVFAAFATPMRNARFRRLALVFLLNGIAASIPATLVLFFIEDVVKRPDLTAVFLIAYFAAGALGLPGWVWLAKRVGKRKAWLTGMGVSIAAFVWAFSLGPGSTGAYFAICVLSGLGLGADLALPPSLLADVIDEDEKAGLGRSEGAYFGLWNLMTKFNLALAAGLSLTLLGAFGYAPKVANGTEALFVLSAIYALLPCALKALAALALWRTK
ncbi:hypothetical protein BWI17_01625 [Betaproteobacteria bacterium GR16-43]|nr:hypothetical protein BWI17_01625 [Betaproteobacteria bacterium GR16-43]